MLSRQGRKKQNKADLERPVDFKLVEGLRHDDEVIYRCTSGAPDARAGFPESASGGRFGGRVLGLSAEITAKYVVSIDRFSGKPIRQRDYDAVKDLRTLAAEHHVAIVLVHHLRKAEADDPFDTVNATLGLTAAVDSVLIM